MQELLQHFGQSIGIPGLAFDEHHYCCLRLDEILLNMEYDPARDELFLYAHLGRLPENPSLALYEALLEGNFFYRKTAGNILGIDKATGILALARRVSASSLTLHSLEKLIEGFVNTAEYWTQQMALESAKTVPAELPGGGVPDFLRA